MRRREYDVVRGLAVIFMIAVHVMLTAYNGSSAVVSKLVDFFGSAPAAPVFMFLLGCNVLSLFTQLVYPAALQGFHQMFHAKARTAAWCCTGKKGQIDLADDFEIVGVEGLDKPYEVKIAAWYDARHDVTIFDVEIAGRRTMITRQFMRFERMTEKPEPTK